MSAAAIPALIEIPSSSRTHRPDGRPFILCARHEDGHERLGGEHGAMVFESVGQDCDEAA
jgi:hypothetical protein